MKKTNKVVAFRKTPRATALLNVLKSCTTKIEETEEQLESLRRHTACTGEFLAKVSRGAERLALQQDAQGAKGNHKVFKLATEILATLDLIAISSEIDIVTKRRLLGQIKHNVHNIYDHIDGLYQMTKPK